MARRALDLPVPPPPHRPRMGETRFELVQLRDTARVLLGESLEARSLVAPPTAADVRFVDGFGHHRPIYRHFAAHLQHAATGQRVALDASHTQTPDFSLRCWGLLFGTHGEPLSDVLRDTTTAGEAAPLHPQALEDAIDHWTYRELVALHALDHLAERTNDDALRRRVRSAALHHTTHTQPDYTTYQPWGLAAFLRSPETASFGEQQLHDVATHLSVEGGRGAVLPGLLLADAWSALK